MHIFDDNFAHIPQFVPKIAEFVGKRVGAPSFRHGVPIAVVQALLDGDAFILRGLAY